MLDTEAFGEFRQALNFLRDDSATEALTHIRRAVELETQNPFYSSYLGLAMARAEQKWSEAEKLCESALRTKRDQPQLYLNLAEVYEGSGRRGDAVETLLRAVRYAQRDLRVNRMLSRLSTRRRPVLPILRRNNIINRQLGLWRHRALRIIGSEAV